MSGLLVGELHPVGVAAQVFRDLEVSLRQRADVAKVSSSVTVGPRAGGFEMEWMVSARDVGTEEIRTWNMWFYWDGDAWVIDRRLTESSESGEIYLAEFDDVRVDDAGLGDALISAATELAGLDPPRDDVPTPAAG
jgi:hypothetical protein